MVAVNLKVKKDHWYWCRFPGQLFNSSFVSRLGTCRFSAGSKHYMEVVPCHLIPPLGSRWGSTGRSGQNFCNIVKIWFLRLPRCLSACEFSRAEYMANCCMIYFIRPAKMTRPSYRNLSCLLWRSGRSGRCQVCYYSASSSLNDVEYGTSLFCRCPCLSS